MRIFQNGDGNLVIDQDEDVTSLIGGLDPNDDFWTYTNEAGEVVTVDVRSHRPNTDVLANMYQRAAASKRPEDAAAYVKHKARVIALSERMAAG